MANSVIDGTIEEAKLRNRGKWQSVFATVTIRRTNGTLETLNKLIVANALVDAVQTGSSGRFYLHSFIDQKGLHGIRSEGRTQLAFPRSVETLLGILGVLNLIMLVSWIAMDGGVRLLPAIFGPLCFGLFVALRIARKSAEQHFAADAETPPMLQPRSAPATSL